jgi:NTE family protein
MPSNWRYIFSRANVLSQAIERSWNIKGTLVNLPRKPLWSINGTTAETGRRFRFKLNRFGDYEPGYAEADNFKISEAMAVSAALPGAIGPLVIKADEFQWKKRAPLGMPLPIASSRSSSHTAAYISLRRRYL